MIDPWSRGGMIDAPRENNHGKRDDHLKRIALGMLLRSEEGQSLVNRVVQCRHRLLLNLRDQGAVGDVRRCPGQPIRVGGRHLQQPPPGYQGPCVSSGFISDRLKTPSSNLLGVISPLLN